jgi:chain length determinant protein EpsF
MMISMPEMLEAARYRWKLSVVIACAIVALAAIWCAVATRSYTASAKLLFDLHAPDPGRDTKPDQDAALIGTQADVIRSQAVAIEVVATLGLGRDPAVMERWQQETHGTGTAESWMANALVHNLSVLPAKGTNVLELSYSSPDPDFAAQIANGFATAYVNTQLRLRTEPAKAYTKWFEEQTKGERAKLEAAQQKLVAFQTQHGLVDTGSVATEANRLTQLSGELANAQANAAEAGARASGGGLAPDALNSGVIQSLRGQIAVQTAAVRQLGVTYGDNHPQMQQAHAQLSALQSQLAKETGAASQSVHIASGAAYAREGQMRGLVAAQKGQMISQIGASNMLNLLQRDVESARVSYDSVTQSLNAMRLQSAVPLTNVSILDTASPPNFPSSPNIALRMLLSMILGVIVGISVAIGLEALSPKTRSPDSLARITGRPVIASISMARPSVVHLLSNGASS